MQLPQCICESQAVDSPLLRQKSSGCCFGSFMSSSRAKYVSVRLSSSLPALKAGLDTTTSRWMRIVGYGRQTGRTHKRWVSATAKVGLAHALRLRHMRALPCEEMMTHAQDVWNTASLHLCACPYQQHATGQLPPATHVHGAGTPIN